jgi:RNA polymerase sigma factor (sigma-70 family)
VNLGMTIFAEDERELTVLMCAAQGGDAAAYERLLRLLASALRRTVAQRRRFLQSADVEDIVQDILLSVHSVRASYDPARPFMPWLMAIVHNRMADAARRHVRRAANETAGGELTETFVADETKDTEERLAEAGELARALGALPAGQRRALEMLKIRELSLREAAEVSGSSVAALKVAVHRAMLSLRKAVKHNG